MKMKELDKTIFEKVFNTRNGSYGQYKITKDLGIINGRRMVRIKFLVTGYETDIRYDNVLNGVSIRDPYYPRTYNVACTGKVQNIKTTYKRIYDRWCNMISRCYNPNAKDYKRYGGIGVKVDPRWLCFENYLHDFYELPVIGHPIPDSYRVEYQVDKDYLQMNIPKSERVYSKDTCIWATINDNINYRTIENKNLFKNKYYGVTEHHGRYITRVGYNGIYKVIGSFSNPIYAANAYNQYKMYVLNDYSLLNDVEYVSVEEYSKDNSLIKNNVVRRIK